VIPVRNDFRKFVGVFGSFADPQPVPDTFVFELFGSASGSVSHKYGSGTGSFHHHTKIVRKTLISTVL
jgi:hypothetical protein